MARLAFVATLLLSAALAGCGDPGPRDRCPTALARAWTSPSGVTRSRKPSRPRLPVTSVLGLVNDPLAPLYPEECGLVVRFANLHALDQQLLRLLEEVWQGIPTNFPFGGSASRVIHRLLGLPETVLLDSTKPFALVRVENGWVGIMPVANRPTPSIYLKPLDRTYYAVGSGRTVPVYVSGFRRGFYLPGEVSVITTPTVLARLGRDVTALLRPFGVDVDALDDWMPKVPGDIERIDLAVSGGAHEMRVDLRLAPAGDSATALQIDRLLPMASRAAPCLPGGGALYFELGAPAEDWEALLLRLWPEVPETLLGPEPAGLLVLRQAVRVFGSDTSCMLDLDEEGHGSLYLVSHLEDPGSARAFLESENLGALLSLLAGPGGRLEWTPEAYVRSGVRVGTVTGNISRSRLREWRDGDVVESTLATLCRGPVFTYVAVVRDKLCVLVWQEGRERMNALVDSVLAGSVRGNEHLTASDSLLTPRLAAVSVDLGALLTGTREAAPGWHPAGKALQELEWDERVPVSVAFTVRGGALRLAASLDPGALMGAAVRVRDALATGAR